MKDKDAVMVEVPVDLITKLDKWEKRYANYPLIARRFNFYCIIILFLFSISCIIIGNIKKNYNKLPSDNPAPPSS